MANLHRDFVFAFFVGGCVLFFMNGIQLHVMNMVKKKNSSKEQIKR